MQGQSLPPKRWRSVYQMASLLLLLTLLLQACGLPMTTTGDPAQAAPQVSTPILVSLTDPENGDTYPISAALSIRAEAISDHPIARMELWADGDLYEGYAAPEEGLGLLVQTWTWSPKTPGVHTLMVRAFNDKGQTAFSNIIQIKGIEDPGFVLIVEAEEGDTALSIAERYHVPLEQILRDNPGLTETTPLSIGQEIIVTLGALQTGSIPATGAKVLMRINDWIANGPAGWLGPQNAPTAPTLVASGEGCSAILSISDHAQNELGFRVYRLSPGSLSFSEVATLPAYQGSEPISHTDTNLYGLYHYYVSAFDGSGETAGNLISLNISDPGCAGEPMPINDLASLPAGVEEYYLYTAINNGPWRRFPADEFTYLKKSDDIDFSQVAASLTSQMIGTTHMRGEVWGMINGTATLLGTFDKTYKAAQPPAVINPVGLYNALMTTLEVRGAYNTSTGSYLWYKEMGIAYEPRIFRFGTDTQAQYGIWQVSSVPFQPGASLNPACLLLTDKTTGSGSPSSPHQFSINLSLIKPKVETAKLSPFENLLSQTPVFSKPYSPGNLGGSGGQVVNASKGNGVGLGEGILQPVLFDPCTQNVSAEGVAIYYVRIIPINNGQPSGKPSNTVILKYDPSGQIKITIPVVPIPNHTYYDVKILNFTGVHVPDLEYEFCVEVVENQLAGGPSPWAFLEPGDKLCPKTFTGGDGDFFSNLADAVEAAFNFISGLYNKLSDWVTDLVEKLNPLCIGAGLATQAAGSGEQTVKDACHYIAVAAVTAAKTYAGLPPSLPNFDQLTNMGKENLVELAAQELEDQGIPCPQACKDVIKKGIDYTLEQVKNSASNSSCMSEQEANQNGIQPLCLPKGIITKPDPRGQPFPAVVEVQVTRRPGATGADFPEPQSCNVSINAYAVNSSHIGKSYTSEAGFQWKGTAIEGNLLNGTGAFPTLAPSESTSLPIILKPVPYWLAGHQEFVKKGWKPEHYDDWYILYDGTMATVKATGSCKFVFPEGTGFSTLAVNGDSIQVGPLGEAWAQTCYPYCP